MQRGNRAGGCTQVQALTSSPAVDSLLFGNVDRPKMSAADSGSWRWAKTGSAAEARSWKTKTAAAPNIAAPPPATAAAPVAAAVNTTTDVALAAVTEAVTALASAVRKMSPAAAAPPVDPAPDAPVASAKLVAAALAPAAAMKMTRSNWRAPGSSRLSSESPRFAAPAPAVIDPVEVRRCWLTPD